MKQQLFNFIQDTPRRIWRIKHPLNDHPNLMVYDNNNQQLFSETVENNTTFNQNDNTFKVEYKDNFNCNIIFKHPISGSVQLMVSNNTKTINTYQKPQEFIKVSNNKLTTIAVHSHDNNSSPLLLFNNGINIIPIDDFETSGSSWIWQDCNTVHIHGNNYKVYSFYPLKEYKSSDKIQSFKYPTDNEDLKILGNFKKTVNDDKIFILLSFELDGKGKPINTDNVQYNSSKIVDKHLEYNKDLNHYINIKDLTYDNNYVSNGEWFISSNIISNVYPPIITKTI